MKQTRRRFLAALGVGSLAAGSFIGSAAFSQTELSRDFSLAIVPDDDAQLALRPGATETDAIDVVDGGLVVDVDGANLRADTAFRDAIEIENRHQSEKSLYVYVPRSVDIVGDSLVATSDVGHESVEFVVDDGGGDLDISLPPEYPDGAFGDGAGTSASLAFGKLTNTGAFELGFNESVQLDLRLLVTPDDEDELDDRILRVRAQRDEPDEDDWDDVGALENLSPGDVLRSY